MNSYNNNSANYIDIMKVDAISSEIHYINVNEISIQEKILDSINNINNNYNSKNTSKFESIGMELYNKFSIIKANHENNLSVLLKAIEKYKNVSISVEQQFDTLGGLK